MEVLIWKIWHVDIDLSSPQFLARNICLQAEIDNPAASSSNILHQDLEIVVACLEDYAVRTKRTVNIGQEHYAHVLFR